jgi:DeoR/GlpR family transcriptional regulator of sugar metabolism
VVMRWFERQRQIFIERKLRTDGIINRADIVNHFGVTILTASKDLQESLIKRNPVSGKFRNGKP